MSNIKLIVTDLDGTLLRTDKTISDYTVSVFKRCRDKGLKTAFATARALSMVTEYLEVVAIDGLVATNGAFIYANGNIIHTHLLPLELSKAILAELGANANVQRISARQYDARYTNKPASDKDTFYDFATPFDEPISHMSFRTDDAPFAAAITAKYPELRIYHITGENIYDVGAKDCTKATGIERLASHFGISLADVVAFGDDNNDIEMLRECGVGIAVANAIDEVKAVADQFCDSNDDDGLARWLEENVLA